MSEPKVIKSVYTFVDHDGNNVCIDSEGLRQWTLETKPEIFLTPVRRKLAAGFLRDNVVDPGRVLQLMGRIREWTPVIFCADGKITNGRPDVMLVDGHHRYYAAAMLKMPMIEAHMLQQKEWEPFIIKGVPKLTQDQLRAMPITKRDY